jgi:hypothetical protein
MAELHHDYMMAKHKVLREQVVMFENHLNKLGHTEFTIPREQNPEMASSQVVVLESMLYFRSSGRQTFEIGPNLQEMFCETSLQAVPREALKFPYACFYLSFPGCNWEVWGDDESGWHPLGGAYVRLDPMRDVIAICLWGMNNENSKNDIDCTHSWAEFSLKECYEEAGDLETYLKRMFDPNDLGRIDDDWQGSRESDDFDHDKATRVLGHVCRVAVNLALYLQTETPEVRSHPYRMTNERRRNLGISKKRIKTLEPLIGPGTVTVVGRELEKEAERRKLESQEVSSPRMHWRRGHWHHYWVGKGRTKRVPRWLMPMLVNKDAEEKAESRLYELPHAPESPV